MSMSLSSSDVYTDVVGLQNLKYRAGQDSAGALQETAEKYEAAFLQMMLKAMRKTTSGEGLFDSDQTRFYQDMFDQQIAQDLAKRGQIGIAEMMMEQLGPKPGADEVSADKGRLNFDQLRIRSLTAVVPAQASDDITSSSDPDMSFQTPQAFVEQLWPLAEKHAASLGVEPEVLLAQAALETGWGQYVVQRPDGSSSHNLFNIKADQRWAGDAAQVSTLEYRDGVARRESASFRAYADFDASFADYAAFIQSGPRYQKALERAGDGREFIENLHRAGYATDPEYARKVNRIMASDMFSQAVGNIKNAAIKPIT